MVCVFAERWGIHVCSSLIQHPKPETAKRGGGVAGWGGWGGQGRGGGGGGGGGRGCCP